MCPFRKVSKTVGQKTVWQLFNTIEYEVWQWAKDEDLEDTEDKEEYAWALNKPAKKLQRWANNEKHTHISIFRLSALQHTRKLPTHLHPFHVLAVAVDGAGAAVAFGVSVAVVVAQLLPPGNFSVIKYLNLIKATNEQPDSKPVP